MPAAGDYPTGRPREPVPPGTDIWRILLSILGRQGKLEWAQAFLDGAFVPAKKEQTFAQVTSTKDSQLGRQRGMTSPYSSPTGGSGVAGVVFVR